MRSAWSAGVGREVAVCLEEGVGTHSQFDAENICTVCAHQTESAFLSNMSEQSSLGGGGNTNPSEMDLSLKWFCFLFMKQMFSSAASSLPCLAVTKGLETEREMRCAVNIRRA